VNCDRVHDLLSEAIDGTLSPVDSQHFHAHLDACPPCRGLFGEVRDSLTLLAEYPTVEVRAGFDERVWARIRAERAARTTGWMARVAGWGDALVADGAWMRWVPLGAAAAVLAWVAVSTPSLPGARVAEQVPSAAERGLDVAAADEAADVDVASDPDFAPVEYPAGMPEAIQLLLEASEQAERELSVNPERYRRSNWQYPIRPMQDPVSGPVVPVSDGGGARALSSRPASTQPGVPVLSF
jgi:anti-sigma factor RsiW